MFITENKRNNSVGLSLYYGATTRNNIQKRSRILFDIVNK